MIIACPNCGAALELPEESVGAKVQCPVCETSFVSAGPEEWKAQTKQRLSKVLQTFSADDAEKIDILLRVTARHRFNDAQFRMLEIEDIIKSPLGFMAIIDCATSSAAALASAMDGMNDPWSNSYLWKDVPGRRGVGLLFENRKYERDDDESVNFEDIRKREVWQRMSSDNVAVPVLLGVDFLNRDLILNLADFNCLYVTGGDTCAQSKRMDVIVKGILADRDMSQVRFLELNFMNTTNILNLPREYYWSECAGQLTESCNKNWKKDAKKYISMINAEKKKREKLFGHADCSSYETYREKHVLPQVVVIIQVEGATLSENTHDLFTDIVDMIPDSKSYGIHFILIDYESSINAFPEYIHLDENVGFISGWQCNSLMSMVAFGTPDGIHAHGDYHPIYRSPNGEVCKFRLAKFPD